MTRALICIIMLASSAASADSPQALADFEEGQRLYQRGDFAAAAAKFEAAYALDPDPTYLFNIAQSYRFANQCARAAAGYRRFLAEVPQAQNRERVEAYIVEMNACAVPRPLESPPTPSAAPTAPATATASTEPTKPRPARSEQRLLIGLALGGVIGVATGAALMVHATELAHEREDVCPPGCTWTGVEQGIADDLDARGPRAAYLGLALSAAGVGMLAVGGYLYWQSSRERRVAVAPGPRGLVLVGRF